MKKAAGILTSLMLVMILLSSTIGISMYQHICGASGKIESSVINDFGCCSSDEEDDGCATPVQSHETAFSHGCCSLSLSFLKTDFISVIKEISADWIFVPVATLPFLVNKLYAAENKADFLFETDTSPPSGWEILLNKQSFLI